MSFLINLWASWLARHQRSLGLLVLLAWLLNLGFVLTRSAPLPRMESGGASQSEAAHVQQVMQDHFGFRNSNALAVVLEADKRGDTELLRLLKGIPNVHEVRELTGLGPHRHQVYWVQMPLDWPIFETESLVPQIRKRLQPWSEKQGVKLWLTGQGAFFYDMTSTSRKESGQAERWGLLLAFIVLLFCFGSLVAAALPLVMGATTLLGTQGALHLLQIGGNESTLILNSMLGLGLSIDYSLFFVSRYREERQHNPPALAIQAVVQKTGRTILYSALVMAIALLVLMIPEVNAVRGTVSNLLVVVVMSALSSLVVLPLLLVLCDRLLEKPRWLSQRVLRWHRPGRWRSLATHVTARPLPYFLVSLLLLLLLALPVLSIRLWDPVQSLAPTGSESVEAFEKLTADGWGGELMPIQVLLYAPQGSSVLDPEAIRQVYELSQQLAQRPEIARVLSLASGDQPLSSYQQLYQNMQLFGLLGPQHPLIRQTPQGQVTVINAFPQKVMDVPALYPTLDWLQAYQQEHPQLQLKIGGTIARARSFSHEMYSQWPGLLGLIMLSIFVALSFYLHSLILPLKASIMNFLPILAAFGILVWAYQWGGILEQIGIISIVPITLFCIVFGLSMDYEVLILSRIDEAWQQSHNVREAVIEGMSHSGGIISGAALILLGVFAPGMFAASVVVREISLGITSTILLDATLVRLLLVPSFIVLMGRWNWWNPLKPFARPVVPEQASVEQSPQ